MKINQGVGIDADTRFLEFQIENKTIDYLS